MKHTFVSVIAAMTMLCACIRSEDDTLVRRTNELLQNHLRGQTVSLVSLKRGERIALPDVLSVDGSTDGRCLSIAFSRADFNERFLRELFYSKDKERMSRLSPFTEPGVESILTADRVVLNLYAGVVIHLQPELTYPGDMTPFQSEKIQANVVEVIGGAVHARPGTIPDTLKTFLYLRDGKAFAYGSKERNNQKGDEQGTKIDNAAASMSLSFTPTVMDRVVAPEAIACTVKPFRG